MRKHLPEEEDAISRNAEKQMRRWALGLKMGERLEFQRKQAAMEDSFHPYITISKETGTGGSEIARLVAERLGWPDLDEQLLDYMAEKYHLPRDMLEYMDEKPSPWLFEALGTWLDRRVVTQSRFVTRVGQIVLMAAQHSSVVVVGRGTQFFLPPEKGVTLRIVAPREQRIAQIMQSRQINRTDAIEFVDEIDRERHDFIKQSFHREVNDPHLYDLVINREHIGIEKAVELIVDQCLYRFGEAVMAAQQTEEIRDLIEKEERK